MIAGIPLLRHAQVPDRGPSRVPGALAVPHGSSSGTSCPRTEDAGSTPLLGHGRGPDTRQEVEGLVPETPDLARAVRELAAQVQQLEDRVQKIEQWCAVARGRDSPGDVEELIVREPPTDVGQRQEMTRVG